MGIFIVEWIDTLPSFVVRILVIHTPFTFLSWKGYKRGKKYVCHFSESDSYLEKIHIPFSLFSIATAYKIKSVINELPLNVSSCDISKWNQQVLYMQLL